MVCLGLQWIVQHQLELYQVHQQADQSTAYVGQSELHKSMNG